MTGRSFVGAIVIWLLMMFVGATIVIAAVVDGQTWVLVLMIALMFIPLTLRAVWLMMRERS